MVVCMKQRETERKGEERERERDPPRRFRPLIGATDSSRIDALQRGHRLLFSMSQLLVGREGERES